MAEVRSLSFQYSASYNGVFSLPSGGPDGAPRQEQRETP